ncbi:hypothetical protein, partial [Treponema sp. R6D11]
MEKHNSDWLTPPLVECIKAIRRNYGGVDADDDASSASGDASDEADGGVEDGGENDNFKLCPSDYAYPA